MLTPPLQRALLAALVAVPTPLAADVVQRQVGGVVVTADTTLAYPGGMLVVQLRSRRALRGYATANFDGHRAVFYSGPWGVRALVPVPATASAGEHTLGIEIRGRRRTRIPLRVTVAPRDYPPRAVVLPDTKRPLAIDPRAVRESRELLRFLRTESPEKLWRAPFRSPVAVEPIYSYGAPTTYGGISPVEAHTDGIFGEHHRGMDYEVPEGSSVLAPAAGTVIFSGDRPLAGTTLLVDHGQGVVTAFFHLGRVLVPEGQVVAAGSPVAQSGASGIAASPHVHWATYLHGVAVDPRVFQSLLE